MYEASYGLIWKTLIALIEAIINLQSRLKIIIFYVETNVFMSS